MPALASKKLAALGRHYGIIEFAKSFNNWRKFVAFSQSDKRLHSLLSTKTTEEAIWKHYYNDRFPGLPFPDNLPEQTFKQAFIARHQENKNAVNPLEFDEETPLSFRGDKEVVLPAMTDYKRVNRVFPYASPGLQADKDVIKAACQCFLARLKKKPGTSYVSHQILYDAPAKLRAHKAFMLFVIAETPFAFMYASPELRADEDVILAAVKQNGGALYCVSKQFTITRELALIAVNRDSRALEWASDELRADIEVVLIALNQSHRAAPYVSVELGTNQQFIEFIAEHSGNGENFRFLIYDLPDELKLNKTFVLAVAAKGGCISDVLHHGFRADREVVLAAVKRDGRALELASEQLSGDVSLQMLRMFPSISLFADDPSTFVFWLGVGMMVLGAVWESQSERLLSRIGFWEHGEIILNDMDADLSESVGLS